MLGVGKVAKMFFLKNVFIVPVFRLRCLDGGIGVVFFETNIFFRVSFRHFLKLIPPIGSSKQRSNLGPGRLVFLITPISAQIKKTPGPPHFPEGGSPGVLFI